VEFKFGGPLGKIGNAGVDHGLLGLAGNNPGILGKRCAVFIGQTRFGKHGQRGTPAEGVKVGRGQIRDQHHVAVFNLQESVTGTIKPDAVNANIFVESVQGKRDVVQTAG